MLNYTNIFILIIALLCTYYIFTYINNKEHKQCNKSTENFQIIKNPDLNIKPKQEFYDKSIFPELDLINSSIIKQELLEYMNDSNKWTEWPEYELWKESNPNSSWKVIPIIAFGKPSEKNISIFTKTVNELKKIPNLVTAGFSKLGTGTTLSFHKGWAKLSNNVLRCHLGLIVPKNKCKIMVTQDNNYPDLTNIKAMYQKENKWIIFDDSLYHSASNDSESDRIVLILDIKRPENIALGTSDIGYSEELDNFMNEFIK